MEEKFTKKELQVFKIIHQIRKKVKKGEIRITFHNFDVDTISGTRFDLRLDGQEGDMDFVNLLTKIFNYDNIN